ncbi:MAG: histidinol-phosphatase HisJ family protein [Clostridia bacterium]|nr:histidinol-phosphatase HisJ family protein [Clostridia bacterium]
MKTQKRCDLHVHTNYSYDNSHKNTMEKNVLSAIQKGIDVLCFTEHIECCSVNTFEGYPHAERKREFDRLVSLYSDQIKLLLGFEMGSPHRHPNELAFLRSLEPDMIIGSIHHPTDYHNINYRMSQADYEKLYDQEVRRLVECGGFDVLGHADMLKKYHTNFRTDEAFLTETLRICVQNGIVPELNTSSMRQTDVMANSTESMISTRMARVYASLGGKYVTISSDSHSYKTLGSHFDETYSNIADVLSLCYFEKGKLVELN